MVKLSNECLVLRRGEAIFSPVDLALDAGEIGLIRGVSGCGKTSYLMALAGYLTPHAGRIDYEGQDLYCLTPEARQAWRRKNLGLVFAEPQLLGQLSVRDNIYLGCHLADKAFDQVAALELCAQVSIAYQFNRPAHSLSRGQALRVALVRALMKRPSVILADEPTSALDSMTAQAVIQCLSDYVSDHGTVAVLTTHDPNLTIEGAKTRLFERQREAPTL